MAFNIVYKQSIYRDLSKIPKTETGRILDHIERDLVENALSYPVLKGPFAGLRKYRVGDYRVIYAVLEGDVLILRIGHRRDVYKKGI